MAGASRLTHPGRFCFCSAALATSPMGSTPRGASCGELATEGPDVSAACCVRPDHARVLVLTKGRAVERDGAEACDRPHAARMQQPAARC
eukprot:COSAG02_NODE_75_length_41389_cov_106.665762_13_plen_90_part_00